MIQNKGRPAVSLEDGWQAVRLGLAAQKSASEGMAITLSGAQAYLFRACQTGPQISVQNVSKYISIPSPFYLIFRTISDPSLNPIKRHAQNGSSLERDLKQQ